MSQYPPETIRAIDRDRDAEGDASERYTERYAAELASARFIDILDELHDCETAVMACLQRKDFVTLGRIVWNVRAAMARRMASRDVYGDRSHEGPSAEQAAAMALYQEQL